MSLKRNNITDSILRMHDSDYSIYDIVKHLNVSHALVTLTINDHYQHRSNGESSSHQRLSDVTMKPPYSSPLSNLQVKKGIQLNGYSHEPPLQRPTSNQPASCNDLPRGSAPKVLTEIERNWQMEIDDCAYEGDIERANVMKKLTPAVLSFVHHCEYVFRELESQTNGRPNR
ncbi:hypothetical protein M3Y98_00399600 [Aphelenchoides besseyi]|nr:hypothetical protein M3Y98_00399600 [Aphelenchoides besseyi]